MKKSGVILLLVLIGCVISGCASIGPEKSIFGEDRVTSAAANQLFEPGFEAFTDEQLFRLLDPDDKAGLTKGTDSKGTDFETLTNSKKIDLLRKAFWKANTESSYGIKLRSQIQDRLIAASNQRCNVYTTYLKRVSTYQNGIFGTLTTILGGAGAIVTGQNSARLLSGLAGISSGTRAELNQATFESLATSVIIPGIQKTRSDLLKEILNKRSKKIDEYTIEGAIADAIAYHGACSMDTGISYAQKSIESYGDIGIKRFNEIQNELGIARSASESFTIGPLTSLVVSEKVLDDFAKKLEDYEKKTDSKNKEQEKLITNIATQKESATKGDLRKEAKDLDEKLKEAMFNFASTTGAEKSNNFSLLDAQQIRARDFARKVAAKNTEILTELK
ncbi:MAG: hypothetical protein Q8M71_01540 [Thermodesulfovibrionales bacterium]|nr:hypothetical protein [Thermodesulfovibrionales bacterium]